MSEQPIEDPDYGGQVIVLSILNDAALDELRRDVTFEGKVYESTIDGNVWSPADHPAGWKLVG